MELTRRDALIALGAMGVGTGSESALTAHRQRERSATENPPAASGGQQDEVDFRSDHVIETLGAVARVLYPASVTGIDEFVRTYVEGRAADWPDHVAEIARMVTRLDDLGRDWHGHPVVALDLDTRDRLLREVGADTAKPAPTGTTAQRVRYFLVNELLYALYASPTGGALVGIENPQGHPGGVGSYRRGPSNG